MISVNKIKIMAAPVSRAVTFLSCDYFFITYSVVMVNIFIVRQFLYFQLPVINSDIMMQKHSLFCLKYYWNGGLKVSGPKVNGRSSYHTLVNFGSGVFGLVGFLTIKLYIMKYKI